jgi:hypothetical protein
MFNFRRLTLCSAMGAPQRELGPHLAAFASPSGFCKDNLVGERAEQRPHFLVHL